ncbi:hypothetical protein PENTCL1PPCAC_5268 [Pristionchus entomophagus]|uniref:Major facilitator superfamily (MFS) profile domain-containing protein n=1 Tax=Pristionchus entomophagus TaxID=358040 RepID=A0AAV5SLU6_9BILA|nr:hypothetical protein PENTCL1PPCAC_5268 [Pristionchus entomophagus]
MTNENSSTGIEKTLSCRDWIVMVTLPCMLLISSYDSLGLLSLLPLIQEYFGTNDAQTASINTSGAIGHAITFTAMWLFGDYLPKKAAFVVSVVLWILFSLSTILVTSEQFWLFVLLRALASVSLEVFRILVNILQAEHFKGKYLTGAITAAFVAQAVATLLSSTVNSIFVSNNSGWRLGVSIAPILASPLLILSAIFLRSRPRTSLPNPSAIARHAIGVLQIPSYLLLAVSNFVSMFYAIPLNFWMPTILFNAVEAHPEVFLGLSFPMISSLNTLIVFVGAILGLTTLPFLMQALESGSALCSCFSPTILATAIFNAISSSFETVAYLIQMTMISWSLPIFTTASFVDGIGGCGIQLFNLQITLTTTPSNKRASALSLLRLMVALGGMPSTQIIGAISDYFRGDSTDPIDRLNGIRTALLYTWFMPVVSTILCFFIIRFYKRDVEKAKEIDQRNEEETAPLISEK